MLLRIVLGVSFRTSKLAPLNNDTPSAGDVSMIVPVPMRTTPCIWAWRFVTKAPADGATGALSVEARMATSLAMNNQTFACMFPLRLVFLIDAEELLYTRMPPRVAVLSVPRPLSLDVGRREDNWGQSHDRGQ